MDVTNFITASKASSEAFKTATLLKTLPVNALIMGEEGVGKSTLASYILPDASLVDGSDLEEILFTIESVNKLIITNIDTSPNLELLIENLVNKHIQVVATAKKSLTHEQIDEFFSVQFDIPPLVERQEDISVLIDKFVYEASLLFGGNVDFDKTNFTPDLSKNALSLRRQVMIHYLLKDINDRELMEIMEQYLYDRLGSNSDYRKFLYLYEAPLIKSGLKRFGSQLKLSDKLGLNRNTLRKKIAENKQYLQGDKNE